MKCYFLRHGVAFDREQWRASDADRPLTEEGVKRMEREAETIARWDLGLAAIVSSPLARAKKTAEIVAGRLGITDRLKDDERLGFGFDVSHLAGILEPYAKADAVMLVGHEPSMTLTIGALIGRARLDLKKGGLACVELSGLAAAPQGELLWLATPRMLVAT